MKKLIVLMIMLVSLPALAQKMLPDAINVSYFGETITHSGLRVGVDYEKSLADKIRTGKNGETKTTMRSLIFRPSLGYFHHKGYQDAFFVLPEGAWKMTDHRGAIFGFGVGVGYMYAKIPDVFELDYLGEIAKVGVGNHHFIANAHIAIGQDLRVKAKVPISWVVKPQYMHAFPSADYGASYFILEAGISYHFDKKKGK